MIRISSTLVLLTSLALSSKAAPTQAPHEVASKSSSPDGFIQLMGAKMATGKPSVHEGHLAKEQHQVQKPQLPLWLQKAVKDQQAHQHHNHEYHPASVSAQQAPRLRLFGTEFDAAPAHMPPVQDNEVIETDGHSTEKAASPRRASPPPPPTTSSSPREDSGQLSPEHVQHRMSPSNKEKEVVVDPTPATVAALPKPVLGGIGSSRSKGTFLRTKKKKAVETSRDKGTWTVPPPRTKKRSKVFRDNRGRKLRTLSTIMEEEPMPSSPIRQKVSPSPSPPRSPIVSQHDNSEPEEELLAQHKFRVIHPSTGEEIPFNRDEHGTLHELGHLDNLHHYRMAADKMVKEGTMDQKERDRVEHNLTKSVKVIGTMMKKKPGTALYHENRGVIFQNPGPKPYNEETTNKHIAKALQRYKEKKLRRVRINSDERLSFKKPEKKRSGDHPPGSDIEEGELVDAHQYASPISEDLSSPKTPVESSSEDDWKSSSDSE